MEIPLTSLKNDCPANVIKLTGGWGFQRKLRTLGIREGKPITVITSQPLGGPLVVEVEGRKITIGRGMAQKIVVETKE